MSTHRAHHPKQEDRSPWPTRRQALWTLAVATLGTVGGGVAWRASYPWAPSYDAGPPTDGPRLELRPTLEPAAFTGKARRAYEVAQEIPGVLDRLKCYCRCDVYGHQTLLSCYVDNHAAT